MRLCGLTYPPARRATRPPVLHDLTERELLAVN